MRHDTAGDPVTGLKWSRRTTRKIAEELTALGIAVSNNTAGRLLKKMDFKLRVNRKQIASTKNRTAINSSSTAGNNGNDSPHWVCRSSVWTQRKRN